jgi:hypothetical protein
MSDASRAEAMLNAAYLAAWIAAFDATVIAELALSV